MEGYQEKQGIRKGGVILDRVMVRLRIEEGVGGCTYNTVLDLPSVHQSTCHGCS